MRDYQSLPAKAAVTILGSDYYVQAIDINTVMLDQDYTDGFKNYLVTYRNKSYYVSGRFVLGEDGKWDSDDSPSYRQVGLPSMFSARECAASTRAALIAEVGKVLDQWRADHPTDLLRAQIAQDNNSARSFEDDINKAEVRIDEMKNGLNEVQARIMGYEAALEAIEVINA